MIVKDLSRLSRNYTDAGNLIENLFVLRNVRFISLVENVDSCKDPDSGSNIIAPITNVMNEWYCRDTSRKMRAVKRAQGMSGKAVTTQAPYGYLLDEDGKFQVDEKTASVVKRIYTLCLFGYGPTHIARMLYEQSVPTPGTMEYRRTGSTRHYYPDYPCKWSATTVGHILANREYTG